jgi:hypothetical protein
MKNSLVAPLFFLFFSLIFFFLVCFFIGMETAATAGQAGTDFTFSCLIRQVVIGVPSYTPLIVSLGLFLTIVRLRKRGGIRVLTFIFLGLFVFLILWGGTRLVPRITGESCLDETQTILWRSEGIQRIPLLGGLVPILAGGGDGKDLEDVLIPLADPEFRLRYFPGGTTSSTAVVLTGGTGGGEITLPFARGYAFGNPEREQPFLTDFRDLGDGLVSIPGDLSLLTALGALSFYLVSCWGFIRISRWNLFNLFSVFLLLRLSGAIYKVFSSDLAEEALDLLPLEIPLPLLPFVAMGAAGAILLLVDLLFIPYNRRIREEEDA